MPASAQLCKLLLECREELETMVDSIRRDIENGRRDGSDEVVCVTLENLLDLSCRLAAGLNG